MTFPQPSRRRWRDPLRALHEFEREFREWPVLAGWPFRPAAEAAWSPRVEVFESGGEVVVRAETPGMRLEDINVTFDEGLITIEGERGDVREEQGRNFYMCEREYGRFTRRVPLAVDIDAERATITLVDGLLTITAPRIDAGHRPPSAGGGAE